MNIAVPVAGFHRGNTGEYVHAALTRLGHESKILTKEEFERALAQNEYERYFCVDSGETFDFAALSHLKDKMPSVSMWYIDYRHNKHRTSRLPTDFENAKALSDMGGWIFQAQFEDVEDCKATGIQRTSWLPMAADPYVWSDIPASQKQFDIAFAGNVWDEGRKNALELLLGSGLKFGFFGHGKLWKEDAAKLLRASKIGFNISSWFGTPAAFDVNMRFFETLSCGVPLITNEVPSLHRLFPVLPSFIRVYTSLEEILPLTQHAMTDSKFMNSGKKAREWIISNGTYELRLTAALQELGKEN